MWLYISNFQTVHTASLSNTDAASPRDVVQMVEPITVLPEPDAESFPALHLQQQMDGMEWCTHWGHVLSQHSTEASKILYFTISGPRNKIQLVGL